MHIEKCERGSIDEFVDDYSEIYYLQNNKKHEDAIDEISNPESDNNIADDIEDLKNVMAWKMGLLDKFGEEESINGENDTMILKGRAEVNINSLFDALNSIDDYDDLEKFFEKMTQVKGVGPVYAITVLHFVSKRKYPLYDRFADIALRAIETDTSPWKKITKFKLVSDTTSLTKQVELYKEYCARLEKVFSGGYKYMDRKVDQALWVYGHMFKMK